MILGFRNKTLERFFRTGKTQGIRPEHIKRLRLILTLLNRMRGLRDLSEASGLRLHQLKGDLKNFWSVTLSGNWRVIFQFDGTDVFEVDYLDYH